MLAELALDNIEEYSDKKQALVYVNQRYDFGNSIGYIINRTAKAFIKALDSQLREKVCITAGQWKVLVMLVDQNGLTQKEIADRLGLDGATLIPIIDKMEKWELQLVLQSYQSILTIGGIVRFFPSVESYNLIFLTAAIVSILSIAVLLRQRVTKVATPNVA
jgi:predicted DNA-binding protein (UPF0251 family)